MKKTRVTRRINHTGRKKIDRSHVAIFVSEQSDGSREFSAELRLGELDLPDDAPVYVEAYYKTSSQRFGFGTVGNIQEPASTQLDEIDLGGEVLFRVKVVDPSSKAGRLLAAADKVTPKSESDEDSREHLIKVLASDIGDDVWRMELSPDLRPRLILNSKIPNAINQISSNSMFQSLILPAVVREVLTYLFWDEEGHIDEETWQGRWISYCHQLVGTDVPDDGDPGELRSWADDVVTAFCGNFKLRQRIVDRLLEAA